MNKIVYGALALSVAGNAFLLLKLESKTEVVPKEQVNIEKPTIEEQVEETVEQVAAEDFKELYELALEENTELKEQLEELESKIEEPMAIASEAKFEKFDVEQDDIKVQQVIDERNRSFKAYETESINSEWAFQTEEKINQLISEAGLQHSGHIESVICKTTVCKLRIKPFKDSQSARNTIALTTVGAFIQNNEFASKGFDMKEDTNTVEMLLGMKE